MKSSRLLALVLMFVCILTGAVLNPAVLMAQSQQMAQDGDVPTDAEQSMFTKGQSLFNQGSYDQAASVLRDLLRTYPNSIIKDLTLLWLGRSYIQLGQLQEAEQAGKSLRNIKGTPFLEIFESELRAAKREAASNPRSGAVKNAPINSQNSDAGESPNSRTRYVGGAQPGAEIGPSATPAALVAPGGAPEGTDTVSSGKDAGAVSQPAVDDVAKTPLTGTQILAVNQKATTQPTTQFPSNRSAKTTRTRGKNPYVRPGNNPVAEGAQSPGVKPGSSPVVQQTQGRGTQSTPRGALASHGDAPSGAGANSANNSASSSESGGSGQSGLNITVRPVAGLVLSLRKAAETASPGQVIQLPLTVFNTGMGEDRFRLETDLAAEYQPTFGLANDSANNGLPIFVTPPVGQGSSISLALTVRVPATVGNGQERPFYVRAVSESDSRVQRITSGTIKVLSAGLSAVSGASKDALNPGETFTQTITFKNEGGASVSNSRLDFVFNPGFELVNSNPATTYDRSSRTAVWSLGELAAFEQGSITLTLRVMSGALSSSGPVGRGIFRSLSMPVQSAFDGPKVSISGISRVKVEAVSLGLTAKPKDVVFFPFMVRNQGNVKDAFDLKIGAEGSPAPVIYADPNGDGKHQSEEPIVSQTGQLDAQFGQFQLLVRVEVPGNSVDRQKYSYNLVARSLQNARIAGEANSVLTVTMPRLTLRTEQISDAATPGSVFFYRIVIINEGSGVAKNLVLEEVLPPALEIVNTEPSVESGNSNGPMQQITWKAPELAPGDTIVLRVGARIRSTQKADASLSTSHTVTYQDTRNNVYKAQ